MRQVFKLRSKLLGGHIHTTVFSGIEGQTLANTGTLNQTVGEWQLFGALLKLGAEHSEETKCHVSVILEGGEEVITSL